MNSTQLDSDPHFPAPANIPSRHDRVLDEAAKQLNSKGVLLTSLAEIAAQLGVSRSAMYYYVADRDDLVFQCYQRAARVTAGRLDEALRTGGTAADILRNFIARMLDPRETEIAARAEIAMLTAKQRDTVRELFDALNARLAQLLQTGQRENVFRSCDVEINARIVLSLVTWVPLVRPWAQSSLGALGHTRLLEATTATLLDGLAPQRRPVPLQPLDLSPLAPPAAKAFDRDGAALAKRDMLLRVASRLFNRKGIDATSLEEIAAQVGATKRTVHHHLGSKSELVVACYERAFNIFFFIKDRMVAYGGSPVAALAAAMQALAIAYPSDELTPLSPLVGYMALTDDGRARLDSQTASLGREYHALIRRGIEAGQIGPIDVEARTLMLPGLISWLVKDDVSRDSTQQHHIATQIADLVSVGFSC